MPELTETCPACGGSGELATSHKFTCYECSGKGKVTKEEYQRILENERRVEANTAAHMKSWEYRRMGG